jgi:hypothetical protein
MSSLIERWRKLEAQALKVGDVIFVDNADSPLPSTSRECQWMREQHIGDIGIVMEVDNCRLGVDFPDEDGVLLFFDPSELSYGGSRFLEANGSPQQRVDISGVDVTNFVRFK